MPEPQNRALVRKRIVRQVDAHEASNRFTLAERALRGRIRQIEPLLHEVQPEHGAELVGTAAPAGFRVVRIDRGAELRPRDHRVLSARNRSRPVTLPFCCQATEANVRCVPMVSLVKGGADP